MAVTGDDRPNVVIVNCDDLGYGDLGCYGSDLHDTPHLDRMAAEGARFTDFLMASPVCSPSSLAAAPVPGRSIACLGAETTDREFMFEAEPCRRGSG